MERRLLTVLVIAYILVVVECAQGSKTNGKYSRTHDRLRTGSGFKDEGRSTKKENEVNSDDELPEACQYGEESVLTGKKVLRFPLKYKRYPNSVQCIWKYVAPVGSDIRVEVANYNIEGGYPCPFDRLMLFSGVAATRTLMAVICGNSTDIETYVTSDHQLIVSFESDDSVNLSGFELMLTSIKPDTCDETTIFTHTAGTIYSPGYERNEYPNDAECRWIVNADAGKVITLEFDTLDIEFHPECAFDRVIIYNGDVEKGQPIVTACGKEKIPKMLSKLRSVLVIFKTDESENKGRFSLKWTAVDQKNLYSGCGTGTTILTAKPVAQEVKSPNFPIWNYPNDMNCQWKLVAGENQFIKITFVEFKLEDPAASGQCYDNVAIGDSGNFKVYCGALLPLDQQSSGSEMFLVFYSDESVTDRGFLLKYQAFDKDTVETESCGIPRVQPALTRPYIVGGTPARPHSWPWQIAILHEDWGWQQLCGGSIIAPGWILTAAHCVYGYSPGQMKIVTGEYNLTDTSGEESVMELSKVIWHEKYSPVTYFNDIALLGVKTDITFNDYVQPVCLPDKEAPANTDVITTGWGETKGTGNPNILNQLEIKTFDRVLCRQMMANVLTITDNMLCGAVLPRGGKGNCMGDSGGPLVWRHDDVAWNIQGVVSFGSKECATPNFPSVYTSVYKYVDWIKNHI